MGRAALALLGCAGPDAGIDRSDLPESDKAFFKAVFRDPEGAYGRLAPTERHPLDNFGAAEKRMTEEERKEFRRRFPWVDPERPGLADKVFLLRYKGSRR